jgi:hypothetical protein
MLELAPRQRPRQFCYGLGKHFLGGDSQIIRAHSHFVLLECTRCRKGRRPLENRPFEIPKKSIKFSMKFSGHTQLVAGIIAPLGRHTASSMMNLSYAITAIPSDAEAPASYGSASARVNLLAPRNWLDCRTAEK